MPSEESLDALAAVIALIGDLQQVEQLYCAVLQLGMGA